MYHVDGVFSKCCFNQHWVIHLPKGVLIKTHTKDDLHCTGWLQGCYSRLILKWNGHCTVEVNTDYFKTSTRSQHKPQRADSSLVQDQDTRLCQLCQSFVVVFVCVRVCVMGGLYFTRVEAFVFQFFYIFKVDIVFQGASWLASLVWISGHVHRRHLSPVEGTKRAFFKWCNYRFKHISRVNFAICCFIFRGSE